MAGDFMTQSKSVDFYQDLLKDGCPWCGEALVIRQGKYGEFIACADWCGYKKSILGRSEYPPPKNIKRPCPYKKCDGKGRIPFVKDGLIIPFAYTHCDCHPIYGLNPEPEHYHEPRLEDYNFPMSSDFRSLTYQDCGVPD